MNTIIKEKAISFKEIEEKIYELACEAGRDYTKQILEEYDKYLRDNRNKKVYRNKGFRTTTIKTIYGEVTYQRTIYQMMNQEGKKVFVYLLDETLQLEKIGLISTNLAEKLVEGITEMSYRECANKVTEMTGQSISPMGVWNVIQALGEEIIEEEKELIQNHKAGKIQGEEIAPILFEEADGVYVFLQGKDRIKKKQKKAEMKVGIAYEGWKKIGKNRYELSNKVAVAGFEKAKIFHEYREARIAQKYNLDETEIRVLNGDGASWIKKVRDKCTHFQLDPFHKYKAIREKIRDKKAIREVIEQLESKQIEEMFHYLEIYGNSVETEEETERVKELIQYLRNNEEGLIPYRERNIELPKEKEGLEYKNMGTMENHIWSIIARRMKHRHASWSIEGGNHLAKILAKKGSGKLYEVVNRVKKALFEEEKIEEIMETLSAAQVPLLEGKGYESTITRGHVVYLEAKIKGSRSAWKGIAGFKI
jgi:hypothetical protein